MGRERDMSVVQFAGRIMVGPGSSGEGVLGIPNKYGDAVSAVQWMEGPTENGGRVRIWLRNGLGVSLEEEAPGTDTYELAVVRATGPYVEGQGTPWRFDEGVCVPNHVQTPEDVWEVLMGLITLSNPVTCDI